MSESETKEYVTCRLTIVQDGISDSVMDVYPAEHEAEKIFLSRRSGIERWDVVSRILNQFTPRGQAVVRPVPYHSDPEDLKTVTLKEEDIPKAHLEGGVLTAPIEEKRLVSQFVTQKQKDEAEKKELLDTIKTQSAQIQALMLQMAQNQKPAPQVNVTVPGPVKQGERIPCKFCDATFKAGGNLRTHIAKFHKDELGTEEK